MGEARRRGGAEHRPLPAAGSRVDAYESFIVVTDAEGHAELSLHGSYTKLRFKPYR